MSTAIKQIYSVCIRRRNIYIYRFCLKARRPYETAAASGLRRDQNRNTVSINYVQINNNMYIVTSLGAMHCIFNIAIAVQLPFIVSTSLIFIRERHAVNVLT